jgi:hypothetical protein
VAARVCLNDGKRLEYAIYSGNGNIFGFGPGRIGLSITNLGL